MTRPFAILHVNFKEAHHHLCSGILVYLVGSKIRFIAKIKYSTQLIVTSVGFVIRLPDLKLYLSFQFFVKFRISL